MWGWVWMTPMMLAMPLFWGGIVLGFVWLVRNGVDGGARPTEETALTVLDRRLAEGAVSLDDYHERRAVLTGAAPRNADSVRGERSSR